MYPEILRNKNRPYFSLASYLYNQIQQKYKFVENVGSQAIFKFGVFRLIC